MDDEPGTWFGWLRWLLSNPEKGALGLVLLAGAWRWLQDLRKEGRDDHQHESFTEMLIRENRELRHENKELVHELREMRKSNGNSQRNLKADDKP